MNSEKKELVRKLQRFDQNFSAFREAYESLSEITRLISPNDCQFQLYLDLEKESKRILAGSKKIASFADKALGGGNVPERDIENAFLDFDEACNRTEALIKKIELGCKGKKKKKGKGK